MTRNETIEKLRQMKLGAMAEEFALEANNSSMNELSFEERFGLIVDLEWSRRRSNKIKRLIHNADFYFSTACVEDIEYLPGRKLDKHLITVLSTCEYIADAHNVMLLGATGAGKTYIMSTE